MLLCALLRDDRASSWWHRHLPSCIGARAVSSFRLQFRDRQPQNARNIKQRRRRHTRVYVQFSGQVSWLWADLILIRRWPPNANELKMLLEATSDLPAHRPVSPRGRRRGAALSQLRHDSNSLALRIAAPCKRSVQRHASAPCLASTPKLKHNAKFQYYRRD
jgi:hypothetical protein